MIKKSNQMENKIVYVGLAADILHKGHLNILKTAKKYGRVVVGLLTDEAIATYKPFPLLPFDERKMVIQNIRYVSEVIPQVTLDYTANLKKLNLIMLCTDLIGGKVFKKISEKKLFRH